MNNFGFDGGAYAFGPAANIERTLYGTTVVRVADDRQSRPQLAMPFYNQLGLSQDPQFKVLDIKTQTIRVHLFPQHTAMKIRLFCFVF